MMITRKSMVTGRVHTQDIPINPIHYIRWTQTNVLIQDVAPYLSPEQREFLITGITSDEWDAVFNEDSGKTERVYTNRAS